MINERFVKLISRFGGYNRVRIVSRNAERLFNSLAKARIPVWSVENDSSRILFNVRISDMDELLIIARNLSLNIVIVEKFGVVKFLGTVKRYKTAIFLFVAILFVIFNISSRIWNVNIYGARLTDENELRMFLYDNGYKSSMTKTGISKHDLELIIKNEFRNITEVTSDIDGINLNISIFESDSPIVAFDKSVPVDIVASKDCIIDEIDVYNGVGMVRVGDSVKKGDVLISGRVEYLFKGEKKYKNVHAIGKTLSYEKVFCDNITVDMYVADPSAEYTYERKIYVGSKTFTYTSGGYFPGSVKVEMKNMQISLGWLKIPILYDEIRWYNKTDCTAKSSEVLYEEIYEKVQSTLPDGYSIKKLSYTFTETADGKAVVSAEAECEVNVGIEREIS